MNAGLSFAVVVPFFNEERNVGPVCRELRKIVRKQLSGGELVLIDDGSNDATGAILDELAVNWPECRVYHFEKNQGQSAALLFAFSKTTASVIVTMDGDGQNDPRDIPKLLARLDEADMVVGARVARKDSWVRLYISRVANRVRANWLGDRVSDSGCALKAFRREVTSAFIPIRTLYSFMPALAVAAGFRVAEEPVNHRSREHGSSRYTVRSFLLFPIIDFIGLVWFNSRRCNRMSRKVPALDADAFGKKLFDRALRRWAVIVSLTLVITALVLVSSRKDLSGLASRRIGLVQAERIALHHAHAGRFVAEELRQTQGHLTWQIDVQLPQSPDLTEIDIDAMDGHVIATRAESPAEEALEVAVEDHHLNPIRYRP